MNHIPKQQWMGCAVATAAMLADRNYEEVATHWPNLDEARMRSPQQLCALLESVTGKDWHLSPVWYPKPRVREFVPPERSVAAWIQDDLFRPQFGQWIVFNGQFIYDPGQRTEHVVENYELRNWYVTMVVQPGLPEVEGSAA